MLPLRDPDQQLGESTRSKLQDLDIRIQGSQNSPTSGVGNTKWRAKISTRVSINPNKRACIENFVVGTGIQEQVRRQEVKQIRKHQLSPKLI